MAARGEKNFWKSDLLTPSACTVEIWRTLTKTEFDFVALLAMLHYTLLYGSVSQGLGTTKFTNLIG